MFRSFILFLNLVIFFHTLLYTTCLIIMQIFNILLNLSFAFSLLLPVICVNCHSTLNVFFFYKPRTVVNVVLACFVKSFCYKILKIHFNWNIVEISRWILICTNLSTWCSILCTWTYGKFEISFIVPHNLVTACRVWGESASSLIFAFLFKFACIKLRNIFIKYFEIYNL